MCSQSKFLTVILAFGIGTCLSRDQQQNLPAFGKYLVTFEHIPSPGFGRVNCVIRDTRGFLWFGTTKGLCKYDGYQIRLFPQAPARDGDVLAIEKLDNGVLLLGTGKGLLVFNSITEQTGQFLAGTEVSDCRITALAKDHAGMLWAGTDSRGLFSFNFASHALKRYTTADGLRDNRITALVCGSPDTLWIGTVAGGLNVLDGTTFHDVVFSGKDSLSSNHITALCDSPGGELWIGTNDGLTVLDLVTRRTRRLGVHAYRSHTINAIVRDASTRIWIAVSELGLLSYSHGTFTQFAPAGDESRSLNAIGALYPDPVAATRGSLLLWVGARSGVDKIMISTNPFANFIRNQRSLVLDRGAVLSLCEDKSGVLWVGLWGGGLDGLKREHGTYRRIAHFNHVRSSRGSLPTNDVSNLLEDRSGNLWIGTSGGLAMLDAQRRNLVVDVHTDGDESSLAGNTVNRVYEDHSGIIWICTDGGLSQLVQARPHRFKSILVRPSEAHAVGGNEVSGIFEDSRSILWVSTYGKGLLKLARDQTFTKFAYASDSTGTHENWIYEMGEDQHGALWLSTRAGLVSFDPRSGIFTRCATDQLYNAHIFGISADRRGDLWLSTSVGLAKYSTEKMTLLRYDADDGLLFNELRSGFFQTMRGTLLAGGLDGFTEFCPDSIMTISIPPPIVMTGLSVFDKALPATLFAAPEISLRNDQNSFSFSFAALDYADSKRNSYAYRMLGLGADWVNAGHRNYASYTNIDPGEYIFQVRGSNSDDVWNESGIAIKVTVLPPYWRTWWFRIVAAVLFIIMAYAAYRYRMQHLLHVERLRLRIAHDLHDDLGSNLSAIAIASKSALNVPELPTQARGKLSEIYEIALVTSEGMKDLVWFIKPETDALDDLFLHMRETAAVLLREVDVDFQFPKPTDPKAISVDFKRSLFLAFKEAITNIAKHSRASKVQVHIILQNGIMEMVVHDDGKGFDTTAHHAGTGLHSLRRRAQTLGGTCEIDSQPGHGTTVRFTAKM